MARSASRPALWPIALFFLTGAAAAVLWDLRKHVTPPEVIAPAPTAPNVAPARTRERARVADPVRPAAKYRDRPAPESNRAPARVRKEDPQFERVGIPSQVLDTAPADPSPSLSEAQAERILRKLIQSRQYYGLSPGCLWARPLGYRDGSHSFEIVASDCESIARGSVIARWRVDATTGEASYRTPEGTYEAAP